MWRLGHNAARFLIGSGTLSPLLLSPWLSGLGGRSCGRFAESATLDVFDGAFTHTQVSGSLLL